MKRICFIEMEGVLAPFGDYAPSEKKVSAFLTQLFAFGKKNSVEFYLVSAHHTPVAKAKHASANLHKFFDEEHCIFVDDAYIQNKADIDKKLHLDNLAKDKNYADTYAKQVLMMDVLKKKDVSPVDALLLADDIWVDGYYTIRFSKIDFAIFEDNVLDRGKKTDRINGLAYFTLDIDSVKQLIEGFPAVNTVSLEKYVFDTMKKALVDEKAVDSIKSNLLKKNMKG